MHYRVRAIGTGLLVATLAGPGAALAASPFTQSNSNGWFSGLGKLFGGSAAKISVPASRRSRCQLPTDIPVAPPARPAGKFKRRLRPDAAHSRSKVRGEPAPHGQ